MEEMRTLLYIFKGKVEIEAVKRFGATQRARVLQGCTNAEIYLLTGRGTLKIYTSVFWTDTDSAPDEIKLAAMLVN